MINTIIDLHGERQMPEDMATVKAAGVTAIIHKATEGLGYVDQQYRIRRAGAETQGLFWGAYHFATGDDPIGQAEHFLALAMPDEKTLVALDLERNPSGPSMSIAQAEQFVRYIFDTLGRWPVLYTNAYVLQDLGWTGNPTSPLLHCPLWVAGYGPPPPKLPNGWLGYSLWQYTNSIDGPEPHRFPGLSNGYDRSQFDGHDFAGWWAS